MLIKGSAEKEKCLFCFRDDLYTPKKLKSGRTKYFCKCGYSWLKETWLEMLIRTGKVWTGYKYDSDYLEEQLNNK